MREGRAGDFDGLRRERFEAFDNPLRQRHDVDIAARVEIGRGFHAGEDDELFDELAHSHRFGAHAAGDAFGDAGIGQCAAVDDVEIAHHDR